MLGEFFGHHNFGGGGGGTPGILWVERRAVAKAAYRARRGPPAQRMRQAGQNAQSAQVENRSTSHLWLANFKNVN